MIALERRNGYKSSTFPKVLPLLAFAACIMPPKSPEKIEVLDYLRSGTQTLAEQTNDGGTTSLVRGKVSECQGRPECVLSVTEGELFLDVRINPEYNGSYAVFVSRFTDTGMEFTREIRYDYGALSRVYQNISYDSDGRLFNTDLVIRPQKGDYGHYFIYLR